MFSRFRWPTRIAGAAACLVLVVASPGGAVIRGTDDTTNRFPNVGVLQLESEGEWFSFCSGTLVAPDVVLTAAHCTDFFEPDAPADLRVSFDPTPDSSSTYYSVDHLVVHPDWFTAGPCLGNSKRLCLAPPAEDIALVWLNEAVTGITPAPVADRGYLDALDLKDEAFTVVGYGVDEFITGSLFSPRAIIRFDDDRTYKEVSVITERDAFPDRFVKITKSVCFGDSGGPLFHDGTVVGINTWTFSLRCDGPNFSYRVDSAVAQAFLDTYL